MTSDHLRQRLEAYGAGLEAELVLLRHLQRLAREQQEATRANDVDELHRVADARDQAMAGLVTIEHELKPLREVIADHQQEVRKIAGFDEVIALHRTAAHLVATILSADGETIEALREAEVARRFAVQAIQSGQNTLAAYRRVIAPPLAHAALLDRRG